MIENKQNGFIITYIIIFAAVFSIFLSGLLGFILSQLKISKYETASEQALYIAEAGLNRYRWYLVHKSQELLAGEELGCPPSDCLDCEQCEYEFSLPGLGVIGGYTLEVEEVRPCDITTAITVTATAWTNDFPNSKRNIQLRYIKPSVADYSYILNHDVWAGSDRIIAGPYHSNGGIRMDGQNNSIVSSEQTEWICTNSYGCYYCPSECEIIPGGQGCLCPGVFTTSNGDESLFVIDADHFDFEGITVDLNQIKGLTKDEGKGLYLPPSGELGYYVILNSRELIVSKILELSRVRAYNEEQNNFWEYSIISQLGAPTHYPLDTCALIFIEDSIWVEGEISGKVTLISADLIDQEKETDVWLKDNIIYLNGFGADGLVLVGQHNVLITPDSPDYMDIYGIFIAQTGHFGRNHYPSHHSEYAKKEELNIYGSIISNGRVGTKWSSGGTWLSGYRNRQNIYDSELSFDPPPFLPNTSEEFGFKEWHEVQ